jgi:hypothetical protein
MEQRNFQQDVYTNTGYRDPRTNTNLIILDSKQISTAARAENFDHNNVYYKLTTPFVVDSPTDVYLEYFHIQNIDINSLTIEKTPFFCIDIPELDIKTFSNNDYFSNKYIIQNESFGTTDNAPNDDTVDNEDSVGADSEVKTYHLKLKSNFISTIQPKTIHGFHVSVTGRVAGSDDDVTNINTLPFGKFRNYYLTNMATNIAASFSTCGAIKIALLFKKREKWNKQVLKLQNQDYSELIYKNTQYFNDRYNFQLLVLDSAISTTTVETSHSGSTTKNSRMSYFYFDKIRFDLLDQLIIDTKTEIYLEYLSFNNQFIMWESTGFDGTPNNKTDSREHLEASSAFYLDIPEFNIKTHSNNGYFTNKYIIPNEIYGKTDTNPVVGDSNSDVSTYHIRLKRNFIGIIEPTRLKRLTVSITGDDFHKSEDGFYFMGNHLTTGAEDVLESSVQIAFLLKKIW